VPDLTLQPHDQHPINPRFCAIFCHTGISNVRILHHYADGAHPTCVIIRTK